MKGRRGTRGTEWQIERLQSVTEPGTEPRSPDTQPALLYLRRFSSLPRAGDRTDSHCFPIKLAWYVQATEDEAKTPH